MTHHSAVRDLEAELISRHDQPGPGYSSYPTPRHFGPFTPGDHVEAVRRSNALNPHAPLSVYVHVPFCAGPCFYCGCARVVRCESSLTGPYLDRLVREISMQRELFDRKRPVEQLHIGGTPTSFDDAQLTTLMESLEREFGFVVPARREYTIEVDPRSVDADRIERIVGLGFNRLSIAVQDLDPAVQAAVDREPLLTLTAELVSSARQAGIRSVAMDLIYGLPLQTPESFAQTVATVSGCRPDRISVFGYAHLAALYKARFSIDPAQLPDAGMRLQLLQAAARELVAAGYVRVGADHFALPGDELAVAARENRLQRNFQGYSTRAGLDLLGLGMTAISHLGGAYSQNAREFEDYVSAIDAGRLATVRGRWLSSEDELRGAIIERLMCGRELRFGALEARYDIEFRRHFADVLRKLRPAVRDRLIEVLPDRLHVTARGRPLVRILASAFDAYLEPPSSQS